MKFTGNRNEIAEAVVNAANGISSNPLVPIRAGMNVQATQGYVHFTGSDGDVTFTSFSTAIVDNEGVVSLPGKLTAEIIKSLPDGNITFSCPPGEMCTITCERAEFKLQPYPEEYPAIPKAGDTNGSITADEFTAAVKAVIPAASKKDSNATLHGLLLDPDHGVLTLVATDRYRVAAAEVDFGSPTDKQCIIPTWAAERFVRGITSETVSIGWDENTCTMTSANFTLMTRQIAGEYANWRKFFPEDGPTVEVDAEALAAAVRRAQLTTNADDPVELRFTGGLLCVAAGVENSSSELLDTSWDDGEFATLFGISYLLDGLNGCPEGMVRFGWTEPLKPVYLASGRFRYTILPRRRT